MALGLPAAADSPGSGDPGGGGPGQLSAREFGWRGNLVALRSQRRSPRVPAPLYPGGEGLHPVPHHPLAKRRLPQKLERVNWVQEIAQVVRGMKEQEFHKMNL